MPISKINKTETGSIVVKSMCVVCNGEQSTEVDSLTLGNDISHSVIALPPCVCGSQEFLQHTFDIHPVEHLAGHRKAVNALAEHLKSNGRVHPKHAAKIMVLGTPPQVGSLLGEVPDSSLPPAIVHKRHAVSVPAPDAVAAAKAVLEAAKAAYAKAVGAATP